MNIRDRILNACQELARIQGFYSMTMDELAERAGVSKRTLYRYFRSKEEVIEATLDQFMNEMATEADRLLAGNEQPREMVKKLMSMLVTRGQFLTGPSALSDLGKQYPHLWRKLEEFRAERIRGTFGELGRRNNSGTIGEQDSRIAVAVVMASIQAVLNPQFILENNLKFEDAIEQLSEILLRAMGI